jgi:pimeloyl-ACP methyl ester carboxylesterase
MPKFSRSGQEWILDRFVASLGIDALMPGFSKFAASPVVGLNPADLSTVAERTEGLAGLRRQYELAAARRERIAEQAARTGHLATARRHYHLAAVYWGISQYLIQVDDDPEKSQLHARMTTCYDKVIEFASNPIVRVEVPFTDEDTYGEGSFPGLLHLPKGDGPWPCVVFLPGTDMFKEQIPNPEDNIFAKRGLACLSIDGPGQGESLLRGLKVRVETWNYERAVSAALDEAEKRADIDKDKLAVFGVSTGSYWSARAAVHEARTKNRIRACAGLMAQWDPGFVTEFEYAQPAFKSNYMYMAGIESEEDFDRQATLHVLEGLIDELECPVLVGQGEFDELCKPDQVEAIIKEAKAWELRIYEAEYHPMGGVSLESWEQSVDWVGDCLSGDFDPSNTVRWFRNGALMD